MLEGFNHVVVGAGSAGGGLSARLSEDPATRVLLLEAGLPDRSFWNHLPIGHGKSRWDRRVNWCFRTDPDPNKNVRRIRWRRGKALGGSSSINGRVPIRGRREDDDRSDDVLLVAGAIQSPRLLHLSGIGPVALLRRCGIPVPGDLPGRGEKLQDHPRRRLVCECSRPISTQDELNPWLVLDTRRRVRGARGLRVVDGSARPTLVSGNTNAPIVMMADKAADMIRADARPGNAAPWPTAPAATPPSP